MSQPFDMSLVQRGARNRRTPYYEATQKYGPAGFTVYNHMYFPIRFDTFEAEFDALLNGVTLWDVAVERCLEISGPDGFRFAQLLTPRDLSTCATYNRILPGMHPSRAPAEVRGRLTYQLEDLLIPRVLAQRVEIGIVLDPGFSLVICVR
jgi:hypothetical protein